MSISRDRFEKNLIFICDLFQKYDIEYLLVGGTAVALNGYFRFSIDVYGRLTSRPDIDVWFNPTYVILNALEELKQDVKKLKNEKSPNPKQSFFRMDMDDFTLDLMPSIKASIEFYFAYQRKETVKFEDTRIYFLNYFDLIADKKASGRIKDLIDIEELKKIREEE